MSRQNGKLPTLDATINLSDDGSKRTYFIAEDGGRKQTIEKPIKSLIPDVKKCIGGLKVNRNNVFYLECEILNLLSL